MSSPFIDKCELNKGGVILNGGVKWYSGTYLL